MRSRLLIAVLAGQLSAAWAQPYAPEQLRGLPWFLAPPVEAVSQPIREEPAPRAEFKLDEATLNKIEAIRASMQPEDGSGVVEAPREAPDQDRILDVRDFGRVLVWLCVIIAAILLLGAALRRFGKKSPLLAGASLAKVMGRVYLDRGVTLHFVETAGKVLVIGVAQNHVSLLSTFEKSAFSKREAAAPAERARANEGPQDAQAFLRQLDEMSARMAPSAAPPTPSGLEGGTRSAMRSDDPEMRALQDEIARLQEYLREEAREL